MRLASSSLKSMLGLPPPPAPEPWSGGGNFLNVSGTERYEGGDMKRLWVSNEEEPFAGVPSLLGGVEGAGEGRWKPSWRWGL